MRVAIHSSMLETSVLPKSPIPTNVITFERGGLGYELLCTAILDVEREHLNNHSE